MQGGTYESCVPNNSFLEQYIGHPASQLQDLRKALYQSVFGCGHLITDTSAAAEGIRRETAEAGPCSREIEALDGPWSRVQLGVLADGLTPETLSRMFARSAAMSHGDADALQEKLTVLRRLIRSGALPIPRQRPMRKLDDWRKRFSRLPPLRGIPGRLPSSLPGAAPHLCPPAAASGGH